MEVEIFQTYRQFFKKYPSKLYRCCCCGYMNPDRFTCQRCGFRADGLFKTMDMGYKYRIETLNKEEEIFKPIELEKKLWQ